MNILSAWALGAVLGVATLAVPAMAGTHGRSVHVGSHRPLPPIAGTLRMHPDAFGHTAAPRVQRGRTLVQAPRMNSRQNGIGARQARAWQRFEAHRAMPPAGETEAGYDGYVDRRRQGWRRAGVPAIVFGTGVGASAAMGTGWGTADSATGGGAYPVPSSRSGAALNTRFRAERPLETVYGEPEVWPGIAPTGGLGYYNSGSPGRMPYYGSSSSAGYGGTPGGLGIYSSGSFGPGGRVVRMGRRTAWRDAYAFGPRIIHVGRRHLHAPE